MARNRQRYMNGKVFYVTDNDEDQVVEIWGTCDRFLCSIPYGDKCEKETEKALKKYSEEETEED